MSRTWRDNMYRLEEVDLDYSVAWKASTRLVFASPAWLRTVGTNQFKILRVANDGPDTFVPLRVATRMGATVVANPPLTPWLFPVSRDLGSRHLARISAANQIGEAVARGLPRFALAKLRLHSSFPSYLGFHWNDFAAIARVSYVLSPTSSDEAWASLRGELRTDIKRAQRGGVELRRDESLAAAAHLFETHSRSTGFDHPFDARGLTAFFERILVDGVGHTWTAWVGKDLAASCVVIEDAECCYYLLAALNDTGRTAKAMSLLTWTVVRDALDRGRSFDFAGSMLPGVERYNRSFGGHQVVDPLLVRFPFTHVALNVARRVSRLAPATT